MGQNGLEMGQELLGNGSAMVQEWHRNWSGMLNVLGDG